MLDVKHEDGLGPLGERDTNGSPYVDVQHEDWTWEVMESRSINGSPYVDVQHENWLGDVRRERYIRLSHMLMSNMRTGMGS